MTDHITIHRALLKQALDALEAAKNGLLWYGDTYPDATNDSDEAMGKIDSALETHRAELAKPEQEESFIPDWANYRQGVADGKAGSPKWHDAPTEPGLWLNSINRRAMLLYKNELAAWSDTGARWFGLIPQDTKAEGEST